MNEINTKAKCIWLTGLSGSGKTTLAVELKKELDAKNITTVVLDGDILRNGLNKDLGYTQEARKENVRRAAEIAKIILTSDVMVISAFMSPTEEIRAMLRDILGDLYFEVFVDTSLEVCIQRDVKGLYKRALKGELKNVSGIDAPFEIPESPDVVISTETTSPEIGAKRILEGVFGE